MMFHKQFYQTQQGEAFVQSQCMWHEHVLADFFSSVLLNLGYTTQDPNKRTWKKRNKTVVVCLTDDFNICGADFKKSPSQWFDSDTVIITDNTINFQSKYRVIRLPESYFGVFGYVPNMQNFVPIKRFHFSINRLDSQRQLILFELLKQSNGLSEVVDKDYINFNSNDPGASNSTKNEIQTNFARHWQAVEAHHSGVYDRYWSELVNALPLRNHNITVEQANIQSYLTTVVETYAGNSTITFSEKTFRALVTPAPWTLFAALGSVSYLQSLGFDVLSDLIDHSYDSFVQDNWPGNAKIANYISASIANYHSLTKIPLDELTARCTKAAQHNQALLQNMRTKWPADFARWLPEVIAQLE